MNVSNKTLAWFVMAAVVVSLTGTIISLGSINITGFASSNQTGNASVSISGVTALNFAVNAIDFGTGSVRTDSPYFCNLASFNDSNIVNGSGPNSCFGFNPTSNFLIIENSGTTKFNVSINFSANAQTLIGGGSAPNPAPQMWFKAAPNGTEYLSCGEMGSGNWTAWQNITAGTKYNICVGANGLIPNDDRDSITIGINLSIPSDASASSKVLSIQASGVEGTLP